MKLEDTVDSDEAESDLEGIVGVYDFDDEEKDTFRSLVVNMRSTSMGLLAAAGVNVLFLVIKQVRSLISSRHATHRSSQKATCLAFHQTGPVPMSARMRTASTSPM